MVIRVPTGRGFSERSQDGIATGAAIRHSYIRAGSGDGDFAFAVNNPGDCCGELIALTGAIKLQFDSIGGCMPNKSNITVSGDVTPENIVAAVMESLTEAPLEDRDKGKGPYQTTGQQSIAFDTPDGGYGRFSYSINVFPATRKNGKAAPKDDGERKFTLKPSELAELDTLIAATVEHPETQVELRTIRETHKLLGQVTFDQLVSLKDAIKAAQGK